MVGTLGHAARACARFLRPRTRPGSPTAPVAQARHCSSYVKLNRGLPARPGSPEPVRMLLEQPELGRLADACAKDLEALAPGCGAHQRRLGRLVPHALEAPFGGREHFPIL